MISAVHGFIHGFTEFLRCGNVFADPEVIVPPEEELGNENLQLADTNSVFSL